MQKGIWLAAAALMAFAPRAQAQETPAGLMTDLEAHVAAAHSAAGKDFAWQADMMCLNAQYGGDLVGQFWAGSRMSANDQDFEPTEIFDGVYYVGLRDIGAYAIKTSKGVVLIDGLLPGQTDRYLIPHLKKVGITPDQITYVIATHSHEDHFGGAKTLQDRYKARVVMTGPDWDVVDKLPQTGAGAPPRRDVVAADGDRITVGDRTFTILLTPGHTVGALSVMFAVTDHGQPHMALLFGGAGWGLKSMPMAMRPIYAKSLDHLGEAAAANHVDVALEGHPFLGATLARIADERVRKAGTPNPLVIGEDGYRRYLTVFKECHAASTDRYRLLTIKYGPDSKAWKTGFVG
ncbi:MAG TPA: MBL fold metallo-hydrolase [Caulobacteraceae bacterium]|jgi:metallo-beta-lactamase class B